MDSVSNNLYNFIYIAVIILGGITLTLTVILQAKERDKQHRAISLFVASIFVYMIADFITYYYLDEKVSGDVVFAMITASDILFCALVVAWVYLILVLLRAEDRVSIKWVILLSAVYQIGSQALSISLGRYDSYALTVEDGIGKVLLQGLNLAYALMIIGVGIRCILLLAKKEHSSFRNSNLVLILLLIGYMVWIAYWDYSTWYKTEDNLMDIYALDPLILFYAILSLFLIYYFYRKDPLRLSESQVASEDAVAVIGERYGLSDRERQVLELMNRGKSNPQIAGELSISENTVKRHINNIFRKTETGSRHDLLFKLSNISELDVKGR
ncbi:MAG: helix-turn-helix transcriptional regulator [Bacillota bacterium]|nr:helix-turn-helix transcriptional regulator [Bacillota bacterium]